MLTSRTRNKLKGLMWLICESRFILRFLPMLKHEQRVVYEQRVKPDSNYTNSQ